MSAYYCIECDNQKDDDIEPGGAHPQSYSHCICKTCAIEKGIWCFECEEVINDPNYMLADKDICHYCQIVKEALIAELERDLGIEETESTNEQ